MSFLVLIYQTLVPVTSSSKYVFITTRERAREVSLLALSLIAFPTMAKASSNNKCVLSSLSAWLLASVTVTLYCISIVIIIIGCVNIGKCDSYMKLAGEDVATKTVTEDKNGVVPVNASSDQGYCICEEGSTLPKLSWTNFKILVSISLLYMLYQGV